MNFKYKIKNRSKIKDNNKIKDNCKVKVRGTDQGRRARSAWSLGVVAGMVLVILLDQAVAAWAAGGGIEDVKSFAAKLTNYVTALAASVAVLFMAISVIRWTMSAGNSMHQTEACNGLVSATRV